VGKSLGRQTAAHPALGVDGKLLPARASLTEAPANALAELIPLKHALVLARSSPAVAANLCAPGRRLPALLSLCKRRQGIGETRRIGRERLEPSRIALEDLGE
jgi:hypothetical protein